MRVSELLNKTRRLQIMLSLSSLSPSAKKNRVYVAFVARSANRLGEMRNSRRSNLTTYRKYPVRHPFPYATGTTEESGAAALLNFIHMRRRRRRRCMFLSRRFFSAPQRL